MRRLAATWRTTIAGAPRLRLRVVDPDDRDIVRTVTRLHLALLSWGPMSEMGERVLERFCYTMLIRDGLMQAVILEVDGSPAGFIAFTDRSITFHRSALRSHLFSVAWHSLVSVLQDPTRFRGLWRTARVVLSRRAEQETGSDPSAEILSIGVLPEYRSPAFVRRTRLRIGELLLGYAADRFLTAGLTRMRMVVDGDNRPALVFYHGLGGRMESFERGGVPSLEVWFDADRAPGTKRDDRHAAALGH